MEQSIYLEKHLAHPGPTSIPRGTNESFFYSPKRFRLILKAEKDKNYSYHNLLIL